MTNIIKLLLLMTMALTMTTACKGLKKMAYTPSGSWDYKVADTPQGDIEGTLLVTKEGDVYKAFLSSDAGTIELDNVKIMDNKLTGTMDYSGYTIDVEGTFEGESFTGKIGLDDNTFPMTATRAPKQVAK